MLALFVRRRHGGGLQSVAARRERLLPLATALEAQPGTGTQEVAQLARKIAATPI
ncbi:MAG: hypothetical protein ACRDRU_15875 [Pseudonocardiaceae bacterium]